MNLKDNLNTNIPGECHMDGLGHLKTKERWHRSHLFQIFSEVHAKRHMIAEQRDCQ